MRIPIKCTEKIKLTFSHQTTKPQISIFIFGCLPIDIVIQYTYTHTRVGNSLIFKKAHVLAAIRGKNQVHYATIDWELP